MTIRCQVEKNLEEALHSLQQEREQKNAIKRELDDRIRDGSSFALHSLASLGLGDLRLGGGDRGDHADDHATTEIPALKQIEADFSSPKHKPSHVAPSPGLVGDLFSEVHVSEIRKLEDILEKTEIEKSNVEQELETSQRWLENVNREMGEQKEKMDQLKVQLANFSVDATDGESGDAGTLKGHLKRIADLEIELKSLQDATTDKESLDDVKDEMSKLRSRVEEYVETIATLEGELKNVSQFADDSQTSLNTTQDDLVKVAEELAQVRSLPTSLLCVVYLWD